MKILIIGGTRFLGRYLAQHALKLSHDVTLFHRGITQKNLFPQAKEILGERELDLHRLGEDQWDVVFDTCAYHPKQIEQSAAFLKNKVGLYCLISTTAVYERLDLVDLDENTKKLKMPKGFSPQGNDKESYGARKSICEELCIEYFNNRSLIIRPGFLVGPFDPTYRFTYWVMRLKRGDLTLLPNPKDNPFQVLDVRDLSKWLLKMAEKELSGVFNVAGKKITWNAFVESSINSSKNNKFEPIWIDSNFLLSENLLPGLDLPLWYPVTIGHHAIDIRKSNDYGFEHRPLKQTIEDTFEYSGTKNSIVREIGLPIDKEMKLINKWKTLNSMRR